MVDGKDRSTGGSGYGTSGGVCSLIADFLDLNTC